MSVRLDVFLKFVQKLVCVDGYVVLSSTFRSPFEWFGSNIICELEHLERSIMLRVSQCSVVGSLKVHVAELDLRMICRVTTLPGK